LFWMLASLIWSIPAKRASDCWSSYNSTTATRAFGCARDFESCHARERGRAGQSGARVRRAQHMETARACTPKHVVRGLGKTSSSAITAPA